MVNMIVDKGAKILAAVGAINWGTSSFLNFDVLTYLPDVAAKIGLAVITASGAYLVYLLWNKKI